MPVQTRLDIDNKPFVLAGNEIATGTTGTIAQDGGRTTPLVRNTLLWKDAATGLWAPVTLAAHVPQGILLADLEAAEIVAGDVENVPILRGHAIVDEGQVVMEGGLTLDTVNTAFSLQMRDVLTLFAIWTEETIDVTEYEN